MRSKIIWENKILEQMSNVEYLRCNIDIEEKVNKLIKKYAGLPKEHLKTK